ncbi:MAG TPA: DEAD/DEAH box helicase [Acidimicrobiales bacterium]
MSSTFAQLGVPADLASLLTKQGITSPFPIQAATLPDALAGRDICGKAPTGSGKTLAFALAMALRLDQKAKPRAPRGLVLVPTRELAAQVQKELAPLARARGRTVAAVYGGTGYEPQRRALRQGVDILVACPGRLEDLIARRDVGLECVDMVVLDEADRMADMGFLPAVRRILDATRPDRQTLLFSATLDGDVDKVVRHYQRDPRRHEVLAPESQATDVEHLFWHADRTARVRLTADLLRDHSSAIVFCRTKHGADRLVTQLSTAGVDALAIHGNRSQGQRERALAAFSSGRVRALIATDVVARGIHVDDVPCIVHFDPPGDIKDYVHRSGRTGRAGATGTVVSLVAQDQVRSTRILQRSLGFPDRIDRPAGSRTPAPPVTAARPARTFNHRNGNGNGNGNGYGAPAARGRGRGRVQRP